MKFTATVTESVTLTWTTEVYADSWEDAQEAVRAKFEDSDVRSPERSGFDRDDVHTDDWEVTEVTAVAEEEPCPTSS